MHRAGIRYSEIAAALPARYGRYWLWQLNEACAVQVIYCRDKRGIPGETLNVNVGGMGAAGLFDMF